MKDGIQAEKDSAGKQLEGKKVMSDRDFVDMEEDGKIIDKEWMVRDNMRRDFLPVKYAADLSSMCNFYPVKNPQNNATWIPIPTKSLRGEAKKEVLRETKLEEEEEVFGDVRKLVLGALQEKGDESFFRYSVSMVGRENIGDYEVIEDDGKSEKVKVKIC